MFLNDKIYCKVYSYLQVQASLTDKEDSAQKNVHS